MNNGRCVARGLNNYRCKCRSGFTGNQCDQRVRRIFFKKKATNEIGVLKLTKHAHLYLLTGCVIIYLLYILKTMNISFKTILCNYFGTRLYFF